MRVAAERARMLATPVLPAAHASMLATPIKPVTDVRTVLSSSSDTLRVCASTANLVTHSGNTGAQVVIPSGSSTSISPDSPMSTSVSPEAKRPCEIGGVDAVLPGGELPPHQAELDIVAVLSSLTTKFQREFTEALSQLHACASHIQVRSGFADSAIKTLRSVVSCLCKMRVSRKNRERNPKV